MPMPRCFAMRWRKRVRQGWCSIWRRDARPNGWLRISPGTPLGQDVDMATEMVDMLMNQNQFEILANVVRRAGDMQKNAIDILA